jgi:small-conductance mechanosensitive channel
MKTLSQPEYWIPLTALGGGIAIALLFRIVTLYQARKHQSKLADSLARNCTRPLFLLLPVFFARVVQPLLDLEPAAVPTIRHAASLLLIMSFGWLLISLGWVLQERVRDHLLAGVRDDRRAKRILTRAAILSRIVTTLLVVLTAAAMLLTFPEARAIGTSIMASAGIAGLVIGIAARPATESLIAGIQVALTEPFSLEDSVVVEGEWGWIEEITSAYVVVRTWDLRRLIVPLKYFLEKPFQNWTRSGEGLIGQVTVEVDYTTPVSMLREEVGRIVAGSALWDGQQWSLQVTEAGDQTIRLRVLASTANPADTFDLRCEIREKLITHLQQAYPEALPRIRATVESGTKVPLS